MEEGSEDVRLLEEKGEREVEGLIEERTIGFLDVWRLPGVAPFVVCLFFLKLVAYTFLYRLSFYIRHTGKFLKLIRLNLRYVKIDGNGVDKISEIYIGECCNNRNS